MNDQNDPRIEAAAKALYEHGRGVVWEHIAPAWKTLWYERAAVALAAADAVAPDIDALLAPFSLVTTGYDVNDAGGGVCWANLWLKENPLIEFDGTGLTRTAAIMDAVQNAKAAKEGAQ